MPHVLYACNHCDELYRDEEQATAHESACQLFMIQWGLDSGNDPLLVPDPWEIHESPEAHWLAINYTLGIWAGSETREGLGDAAERMLRTLQPERSTP